MDTPDERALEEMLVTVIACAGVALEPSSVTRLARALALCMTDWKILARTVSTEIEPMMPGRWPEGQHEMD